MKEPFHFKDDLYAYSVDRLIELCKDPKNHNTAFNHIRRGNIEKWLNYIGEVELCNIVNRIRTDLCNTKVECLINQLSEHLNNRKFIASLDIDKAIEITLKEYETLRTEILQNIQERNQLIGLGLAAIFTVSGFGLAPLAGFFTVEETSITTPIEIQQIYNKTNNPKNIKIKKFTIERTTKGDTINNRGIIPSVVIFSWLIPIINDYIIFRILDLTKRINCLGEYISLRIEKRLVNLTKLKADFFKINFHDHLKVYGTSLFWENFIETQHFLSKEQAYYFIILILFGVIRIASLIGGIILFLFDFSAPINKPTFMWNHLLTFPSSNCNWGIFLLIILPVIIFIICLIMVVFQIVSITNSRKRINNSLSKDKVLKIISDMWDN